MKNKRSFVYVIWIAAGSMTAIAALMAVLSIQSMQKLHGDFAELRTEQSAAAAQRSACTPLAV